MDYFRSVFTSSLQAARPAASPRYSDYGEAEHLTPPPREDDSNEPPPFVAPEDDHVSLSQVDTAPQSPAFSPRKRLQKQLSYRSSSSYQSSRLEGSLGRTRSDPIIALPPGGDESPRRRNSTPLDMSAKPLNTYHPNSPLTQDNYHHTSEDEGDDLTPEDVDQQGSTTGTMATTTVEDSRRPSSNAAVIAQWLSNSEDFRSPCAEHINQLPKRVQTLPPGAERESVSNGSSVEDKEPCFPDEADQLDDFEGFEGSHRVPMERADTAPSMPVPTEIRLRRASKQKQEVTKRLSLPLLTSTPTRHATNIEYLERSRPRLMSTKSALVGPALTHAWTHRYVPEGLQDEHTEDNQRRLSSTLQVVSSRNSVYEVIWEDTLAAESLRRVYVEGATPHSIMSAPATVGPQARLDRAQTTMAAWFWGGNEDDAPSRPHSIRTPSTRRSYTPALVREPAQDDQAAQEEEPEILAQVDTDEESPKTPTRKSFSNTTEQSYFGPEEEHSSQYRPQRPSPRLSRISSPSLTSVIEAANRTPSPTAFVAPSAISAQQRRELLGNRKVSYNSSEEDQIIPHRDSLVLAHKRIFYDQMLGLHHGEEAPDPRINELKSETWHIKRDRSSSVTSTNSSHESDGSPPEPPRRLSVIEADPVSILVHDPEEGKRKRAVRSVSGKHIHLVVDEDNVHKGGHAAMHTQQIREHTAEKLKSIEVHNKPIKETTNVEARGSMDDGADE